MANLTQLRMLENLSGFVLVDKPAGIAFSTVVKTVKRKFNLVKVGHGGSLDAMASGLLVLIINDANRFVDEVMGGDRAYSGTMRLGLKTTTHDVYGEKLSEVPVTDADFADRLEKVLPEFRGDVFQTEPRFCSIRREGSASYEVADTGEHTQFLSHVYRFQPTAIEGDRVRFDLTCSKSLLVRTLVNDMGDALGCGACLEGLRRTRNGPFSLQDARPFEELLDIEMKDFPPCVLPTSQCLR